MSVYGDTYQLWIGRNHDNGELLALLRSLYNVRIDTVKWSALHALDIYNKTPTLFISEDFTVAEWETWYAFNLVPIIHIDRIDNPNGQGIVWDWSLVKPWKSSA